MIYVASDSQALSFTLQHVLSRARPTCCLAGAEQEGHPVILFHPDLELPGPCDCCAQQ